MQRREKPKGYKLERERDRAAAFPQMRNQQESHNTVRYGDVKTGSNHGPEKLQL